MVMHIAPKPVVLNPRAACGPSQIQMRPTVLNVTVYVLNTIQK